MIFTPTGVGKSTTTPLLWSLVRNTPTYVGKSVCQSLVVSVSKEHSHSRGKKAQYLCGFPRFSPLFVRKIFTKIWYCFFLLPCLLYHSI